MALPRERQDDVEGGHRPTFPARGGGGIELCQGTGPGVVPRVSLHRSRRAGPDGCMGAGAALARLSELAAFAPFTNGFYRGTDGAAPIGADPLRAE